MTSKYARTSGSNRLNGRASIRGIHIDLLEIASALVFGLTLMS
jgi:hypothetical protein